MELQVLDLKKSYKHTDALKGISFTLQAGIYGLLGPNGSGKSTLMNIVTGNVKASKGNVLWNGEQTENLGKEYRKILGFVPQQQALYPDFTVIKFLSYIAALREISKETAKDKIAFVLEVVELKEVANYKIKMLSGGMKQRLLIAQAILDEPELLIMDEPTVGLDPKQRYLMRDLIQRISKDRVVIIATHIVSDIEKIANEILLIKSGELLRKGSKDYLINEVKKEMEQQEIITLEDVFIHHFGE